MLRLVNSAGSRGGATSFVPSSPVLFIHGSVCNHRMWNAYETALAPRASVAIDLPGYGDAEWSTGAAPYRLVDATRAIPPAIHSNHPIDIVAHSFGGAVALRFALEHPSLVRTLTLIEPSYFSVLRDMGRRAFEAFCAVERIAEAFSDSEGDGHRFAMARFFDFWNGRGTWAALGPERQHAFALKGHQVRRDFEAIFAERIHLSAFRRLVTPTLLVTGTTSPAASLLVTEGIRRAAPRASSISISGAGHMLPITHVHELTRILRDRLNVDPASTLRAA